MTSSSGELENVGLASVMIVICTLGVGLNFAVIFIISGHKQMRASTDMFVINLAVSDILLSGVALPLKLNTALYADGDFHGGDVGCKLIQFIPFFTIMCSISTMVTISLDRFLAISKQRLMKLRATFVAILIIWLVSFATSAPQLYEYSTRLEFEAYDNSSHISCGSHDIPENFETIYAIICLCVSYILPLLLITVNYTRLFLFLRTRGRRTEGTTSGQGGYQLSQSKVRILQLLISLTTIFALLWLPYFVLFAIEEITDTDNSSESNSTAHAAKHFMMALSTITNPILYVIFNRTFRRELTKICQRNRSVGVIDTNTITSQSTSKN